MITYHTDGSCNPNPGKGGWAYIKSVNGVETKDGGSKNPTTNNEMELMAVMKAMYNACSYSEPVTIYCDSQRVVNMMNLNWKPKVYKQDIASMRALLKTRPNISVERIASHSSNKQDSNNMVDRLAKSYSMM